MTLLEGYARLTGPHEVELATLNADGSPGHQGYSAERILIATGGQPYLPHFQGREHVISSDQAFDLDPFPQRLLVVGGGYIACEFASIFNGLGARVTQVYRGEQILRGFDDEIRHFTAAEMRKTGVDLRLAAGVLAITREADGLHVTLEERQPTGGRCRASTPPDGCRMSRGWDWPNWASSKVPMAASWSMPISAPSCPRSMRWAT